MKEVTFGLEINQMKEDRKSLKLETENLINVICNNKILEDFSTYQIGIILDKTSELVLADYPKEVKELTNERPYRERAHYRWKVFF